MKQNILERWQSDSVRKAFIATLVGAREAKGVSQTQTAKDTGIKQANISYMEHGPYPGMNLIDIATLCLYYGLDIHVMLRVLELEE